jgi:acetyl-CoA carboxylase carboxyltransferase component
VIDDIIDPRETRQTIAKALQMSRNKHVEKPKKRHGVMPV